MQKISKAEAVRVLADELSDMRKLLSTRNYRTKRFDLAALKPLYGVGDSDLSSTTDLTAAVLFQVPGGDKIYVLPMF